MIGLIVNNQDACVVVMSSFAEGGRLRRVPAKSRPSEDWILARAAWLMNTQGREVGEKFLDDWANAQ